MSNRHRIEFGVGNVAFAVEAPGGQVAFDLYAAVLRHGNPRPEPAGEPTQLSAVMAEMLSVLGEIRKSLAGRAEES